VVIGAEMVVDAVVVVVVDEVVVEVDAVLDVLTFVVVVVTGSVGDSAVLAAHVPLGYMTLV